MTTIYFSKVNPSAVIPSKIDENAGFDIYACFDEDYIIVQPHETIMIPTGIASACETGYFFKLMERGSTGIRGIGQRCGVIDSGYRGEWFVPITNLNEKPLLITKEKNIQLQDDYIIYPYDKAICQAVLLPVPSVEVVEIDINNLMEIESMRGCNKLGSSGK